ncbi:MAG: anti-sigma factor [Aphanocapsa lilacina HA4352-LM1]|jgi:anti-sigma-K factor RskA|nr:anti-sigma factor [Aphanocapsa lilacina HA4352-LM1]
MSGPQPPEEHQALLVDYVLEQLNPEQTSTVQSLIARDPAAAAEVERLRRVRDLLPYGVAAEPPAGLESAILAAMDAAPPQADRPRPQLTVLPWRPVAAAAAAVLVLALGIDSLRLRHELSTTADLVQLLQQPNTRLFALRGTGATTAASGSIVMDLDRRTALVAIQNLPASAPGQTYHLWAIVDGEPLTCGEFKTDTKGTAVARLEVPPGLYSSVVSQLLVTREAAGSVDKPGKAEVMISVT